MREGRKNYKSIKKLAMISSFTAVVLIVSTYAWFIGMKTVSVNSFDVEIKAADSLMLSLDGDIWKETIDVSEAILDAMKANTIDTTKVAYTTSTHSWGGTGLIPMSTIGEMTPASSRMKLFEKASLTATPGGYRLMASQVDNVTEEQPGYIVFDLFVKNFSGRQYIKKLDTLDEEAIYLTIDSEVIVSSAGVEETGIENSVRVAFAQIGRVDASPDKSEAVTKAVIQGISCAGDGDGTGTELADAYVTGICRTAQIWEPNDTRHVNNAISWYNNSCKGRKETGTNVRLADSFEGSCGTLTDGIARSTYAVRTAITSGDNVDTYDGSEYNGYITNTTRIENQEIEGVPTDVLVKGPLEAYPYFTDSTKHLRGNSRSSFLTLAPNSITKVRVYVYIEGQDVDNYDYAAIGKQVSIKFGFTKERYTEDDINYTGPILNQNTGPSGDDKTPPVITLNGNETITYEIDSENPYVDAGATARDTTVNKDGDGNPILKEDGSGDYETTVTVIDVEKYGVVNDKVPGQYVYTYIAKDASGNIASKTRTVIVKEKVVQP